MNNLNIKIKALTPIWTGDADRKCNDLKESGIIGSLRWWYEALIRGLDGNACDPTDESSRCKLDQKKFHEDINSGKSDLEALNEQNICPACQLFGCTGWARKFRLEVEKLTNDEIEINLRFIELREMKDVEWALLNKTIKIISDYGAIGAKIADSNYGVIQIKQNHLAPFELKKEELSKYLKKKNNGVNNPNLSRFIFTNQNLDYDMIKQIKKEIPSLKGSRNKGKRYFYKTYQNGLNRFFAYGENYEEYKKLKNLLTNKTINFVEGTKLLEELK